MLGRRVLNQFETAEQRMKGLSDQVRHRSALRGQFNPAKVPGRRPVRATRRAENKNRKVKQRSKLTNPSPALQVKNAKFI